MLIWIQNYTNTITYNRRNSYTDRSGYLNKHYREYYIYSPTCETKTIAVRQQRVWIHSKLEHICKGWEHRELNSIYSNSLKSTTWRLFLLWHILVFHFKRTTTEYDSLWQLSHQGRGSLKTDFDQTLYIYVVYVRCSHFYLVMMEEAINLCFLYSLRHFLIMLYQLKPDKYL